MLKEKTGIFSSDDTFKIKTVKSYTTLINETVKNVVGFEKNITKIRPMAYAPNNKLTEIIISNSITSISRSAFSGCRLLTKNNNSKLGYLN